MNKMLNIGAAMTAASIGAVDTARLRVVDGTVQIRFGGRKNTSNLPKGETVRPIGVKASGRRISLPASVADAVNVGDKVAFVAGKYGWYSLTAADANDTNTGSISAK